VARKRSFDILEFLARVGPQAIQLRLNDGSLPLNVAALVNAPIDWVEYLTILWPNALQLRGIRGFLPVHVGAKNDASLDVIHCLSSKPCPGRLHIEDSQLSHMFSTITFKERIFD
jgi:hypothetical protein